MKPPWASTSAMYVHQLVVLLPAVYKATQPPPPPPKQHLKLTQSIKSDIHDLGYYTHFGSNLFKLCSTCLSIEFLISAIPQSSTTGNPLGRLSGYNTDANHILLNSNSSPEMFLFVSIIHEKNYKTYSIFYHCLHTCYNEVLTNLMIFRIHLLFSKILKSFGHTFVGVFPRQDVKIFFSFHG
jgi:hypothetical protein